MISLELCAGAGGTALGLERAGFHPAALIENDAGCCETLRRNRPGWPVIQGSIENVDGRLIAGRAGGIDLLSAGLPCTPHSRGGKQLGEADERHLWSHAMRIVSEASPRAIMFETADAILTGKFDTERSVRVGFLHGQGYQLVYWAVADASRFGVPQRRPRAVLVALRDVPGLFTWPEPSVEPPPTAGDVLFDLMAGRGWPGADAWRAGAQDVAPTVVGGSKKHGGPDLSAGQGKAAWRRLGIDPMGIADEAPGPDGQFQRGVGRIFDAAEAGPMLTVAMAARLQGFPGEWEFTGGKTSAYRQVGNAFPPPVAHAVGEAISQVLAPARGGPRPVERAARISVLAPSLASTVQGALW